MTNTHIRLAYKFTEGFVEGVRYTAQPNKIQNVAYKVEFKKQEGNEWRHYVTTLYFASRKCKNPAAEIVMRDNPGARIISVVLK